MNTADDMHRVMLGTAGTGTSWGVLTSLRETFPRTFVLATDMAPARLIPASAVADRFVQTPAIADPAFRETVLSLIRAEAIDTYIPIHDPEVILAGQLREEGLLEGVACPAPPAWASTICWDKLDTARWLADAGHPTPESRSLDDVHEVGHGWIVKPRQGVGSVGVSRLTDEHALKEWQARDDRDDYLAQTLLAGPELTLDCFLGGDGFGRVVCRERIEVKSGVCTKARVFEDEQLAQLGVAVGRGLELRGAYCLQVIQDSDSRWLLTDVNPRTGAGTRMSAAVGVNMHGAMLADLWGLDPQPYVPRLSGEHWVARYYREAVLT